MFVYSILKYIFVFLGFTVLTPTQTLLHTLESAHGYGILPALKWNCTPHIVATFS